jgi:proline iminopeptidase
MESTFQYKGHNVWFRVEGSGNCTPVILLHGGPGAPSNYLDPLQRLADDRQVIFFDQIGCGRSPALLNENDLNVNFFVEQVETLRIHLGLDGFILYGQSWGGALGLEYYLKYPKFVKGLIFSSPLISTELWLNDMQKLLKVLPENLLTEVQLSAERNDFSSQEYQKAMNIFYENYVSRKLPWSEDILKTFENFGGQVYNSMWGPSEFQPVGLLKNYDRFNELHNITVPTLFIIGQYDEVLPETAKMFQNKVPNSELKIISDAAHLTMQDNTEEDLTAIREFLIKNDL